MRSVIELAILAFLPSVIASSTTCTLPIPSSLYVSGIPSWQSQNFSCIGSPQAWTAKPSPGKGIGVFATRILEPGDIILQEPPIIRVNPPEFRDGAAYPLSSIETLIRNGFEALSEDAQAEVMALHAHMTPKDADKLLPIFRSNAYTIETEVGLFPKGARINHSCRPNSSQFWNARIGKRVVYAIRRIEEGEEIFATYIPLLHAHEVRQKRLDQFGFKCGCEACAQELAAQEASDKRRQDIRKAFHDFEPQLTLAVPKSVAGRKNAEKNAKASVQLATLVEEEGLADYYPQAYRIAAISHARIERWEPATIWAHKSYQLRVMADSQSAETLEMHALTARFISSWNDDLRNKSMRQA
ncbi:SET domain-containing protein [Trematosphaeria pertusa]|uniref:SET domain-containing protein n=1 Tax=Trematosphaeria pertusa TaxID=390896 RepID=A0A6A6I4N4_9PLEO|nr:SET domain-containing protein [Trematosphaeria pertusa]KAF2245277.1 SET domain-containing protein [Trematosphaeria pertusa]